jgi:hypothetical protein
MILAISGFVGEKKGEVGLKFLFFFSLFIIKSADQ